MKQEKYGKEYRDARGEKMKSVPVPSCEVTYSTKELETHHNQPKMFQGPDIQSNLVILQKDFHAYLHQICNVKDNELIYRRNHFSKSIWNDPNGLSAEGQKKRIAEIDDVLMREYIDNMILGIGDRYRDKVIALTILSNMHTIRELSIENRQLKDQIQKLTTK